MNRVCFLLGCFVVALGASAEAREPFEVDVVETAAGPCRITFIGHGSLMFAFDGKIIHVDPYGKLADYSTLPKADLILITHEHRDHLDPDVLQHLRKAQTAVVSNPSAATEAGAGLVMKNGDVARVMGIGIEAVAAYNMVHKRGNGEPFHPRGVGNAYILTFGDKRVYIAGDSENTPEMKALKGIDVAFLPMNLPYTMTPEMVADAATAFQPQVLYPYHYGETDPARLVELLKEQTQIEVRIRKMQ